VKEVFCSLISMSWNEEERRNLENIAKTYGMMELC
jgi:hypothetical protein